MTGRTRGVGKLDYGEWKIKSTILTKVSSRVRVRLINPANARFSTLTFTDVTPNIIALDGYPVTPFESATLTLGPAQRVDLIIDLPENLPMFRLEIVTNSKSSNSCQVRLRS